MALNRRPPESSGSSAPPGDSLRGDSPGSSSVAEAYAELLRSGSVERHARQEALALRFDRLIDELKPSSAASKGGALGWLLARGREKKKPIKGLYVHGGVGRGKSMLMDLFFSLAPEKRKRRVHFNEFMNEAQERIQRRRKEISSGKARDSDPVPHVGRRMASEARLLCFDELSVSDIADAMILGRLFQTMFEQGVVVAATSNLHPDELYRDGLNRSLFLPFVSLLKKRCEIFELDGGEDFRLSKRPIANAWLSPAGGKSDRAMLALWEEAANAERSQGKARQGLHAAGGSFAPVRTADSADGVGAGGVAEAGAGADEASLDAATIRLKGRTLRPERAAGGCAWFSFDRLCREPRSAADYLALAERFHTLFLSGVPIMGAQMRNEAKRFILLIDTLYDHSIRVVISAQASPHALWKGSGARAEGFEFARTASRLIEMQSREYSGRASARISALAESRQRFGSACVPGEKGA